MDKRRERAGKNLVPLILPESSVEHGTVSRPQGAGDNLKLSPSDLGLEAPRWPRPSFSFLHDGKTS